MRYRLDQWSVVFLSNDPFVAPECNDKCLHGKRSDGRYVRTSPIAKVDGRIITTDSGNVYELGEVSEKYLEYLSETGKTLDEQNPIRHVGV